MATTKQKVERALYGPSFTEVTLGAVLSLLLGAFLAIVYLVAKPVQTVRELPPEPEKDVVYFVEGSRDATKGRQWMRKRQMLVEEQAAEISLTEDELNAWFASGGKPATTGDAAPAGPVDGLIGAESVNFRIRDSVLQVGVPSTVNLYGFTRPVVLQARGGFEKRGDEFVFVPDEMMIGSLPAHRLPGVGAFVRNKLLASQTIPEELAAGWNKLSDVSVDGAALRLTLP